MLHKRPAFHLSKWYLDCVDADGTVFIGYSARLQLGPLPLYYSSSLLEGNGKALERRSYRRVEDPVTDDRRNVRWRLDRLGIGGDWNPLSVPVERVLYSGSEGTVLWRCHAPRAQASVTSGGGVTIEGLGYVEQLVLTAPPWKLPVRSLRWGRFLSPNHELIWICWEGDHALQVVTYDQLVLPRAALHEDGVDMPCVDQQLEWCETREILRRPVLGSAWPLRVMARVAGGKSGFDLLEERWLSRGTLTGRGIDPESGWVLHERVTWS
jgi:hypothetical protein